MKTFAFERWRDRHEIPTATRDFLLRLRSSPPARRVQGRLLNVCGTYASRKMGVSIQFESHLVELWAIYTMEYDRAVLEFFDQPCQLELHYQGPSGRPTRALHTPDFLVLRTDGATFEEWKPEEKLLELMTTRFCLKHFWLLLPICLTYRQMRRDLNQALGLTRYAFLPQSPVACCTLSLWESEAALSAFSNVPSHVNAVRCAKRWCRKIWSAYWRIDAVSEYASQWQGPGQGQWPPLVPHPAYPWHLVPQSTLEGVGR